VTVPGRGRGRGRGREGGRFMVTGSIDKVMRAQRMQ
jgi:hypothetical protein